MTDDLIFDIGMNNGDDTAFYLREGFRVVAVEANPTHGQAGEKRFAAEIAARRLTILNVGIAEQEATLPFWICDSLSEWSSFDRSVASRDGAPHHAIQVPCRRFHTILEQFGVPFYLKIDIEGNDMLYVRYLPATGGPQYVSPEVGDVSALEELRQRGYSRFKCISQYHYLPLELPPAPEQKRYERIEWWLYTQSPLIRALRGLGLKTLLLHRLARTRRLRGWTFPFGSSGPFGKDLSGKWQSLEEMAATYQHFQASARDGESSVFWHARDYSFWSDFHARRDGVS